MVGLFAAVFLALLSAPAGAQTPEDIKSVDAWFAKYDDLAKRGNVQAMADMAAFPLQVVTTDGKGQGHGETWDRQRFIEVMTQATSGTPKDMRMEAKRQPFFLDNGLVAVITDATVTSGNTKMMMRYADILVKKNGAWVFQTMAQGGWGDMLKAAPTKAKR